MIANDLKDMAGDVNVQYIVLIGSKSKTEQMIMTGGTLQRQAGSIFSSIFHDSYRQTKRYYDLTEAFDSVMRTFLGKFGAIRNILRSDEFYR